MENKNIKKSILIVCACVLSLIVVFCKMSGNNELANTVEKIQDQVINEIQLQNVVITDEIIESSEETIEATLNEENLETIELITSDIQEENELESDAIVDQENISYDGLNTGNGLSLLGAYQGLTYYSQADSRWASEMYSSVGDRSQTMKSSACRSDFCSNGC